MEEEYTGQQLFSDMQTRLRDVEEKQRLLRDRVLLLGQTLIEERENTFKELQELKKSMLKLTDENERFKELFQRVAEQLTSSARKEEVFILQRQLDILRAANSHGSHRRHKKNAAGGTFRASDHSIAPR